MAATEQHEWSSGVLLLGTAGNTSLFTQTITINGGPSGGTWTATYGGQTTATIAYNAIASAVASALAALSSIGGAGNVTVTGGTGGPYTVTLAVGLGVINLITANGAALTGGTNPSVSVTNSLGTVKLADVQDVTFDTPFTSKTLYTSAGESVYPIDYAAHEGKPTLKVSCNDFNRFVLTTLINAVKTTVGSVDTFTFNPTTQPQSVRCEFYSLDTSSKVICIVATKAYAATGMSHAFKLTDFGTVDFTLEFISDPNATGATGYGIPYIMSMQQ
jgi:hypothetical protein